ncbi:hypothetical protein CEXT_261231 [Caerostris extrusa]|uniref:Uncharacterized protein n=1 Tax=Caerostris extrusa TaxID=172846 RepID=A0AAV4U0F3_CAEEX|nr:hypothetical protein CEXT_261231 [Caerostris extrusa]
MFSRKKGIRPRKTDQFESETTATTNNNKTRACSELRKVKERGSNPAKEKKPKSLIYKSKTGPPRPSSRPIHHNSHTSNYSPWPTYTGRGRDVMVRRMQKGPSCLTLRFMHHWRRGCNGCLAFHPLGDRWVKVGLGGPFTN